MINITFLLTRCSLLFAAIRPKILPASLSPVILGSVMVPADTIKGLLVLSACGCALFFQVAVNLANDYFDARSGVDTDSRIGPMRVTHNQFMSSRLVIFYTILFIALACLCGLILALNSSWLLLIPGLLCILATLAYSGGPFPLASHGLGEVTVLVFFGWVAVLGSYYVHTLSINLQLFCIASALGLVQSAIMLVNNLRDIATDKSAGKNTVAVYLGDLSSRKLYTTILIVAAAFHYIAFAFLAENPDITMAWLPLALCLPFGLHCNRKLWRARGAQLNSVLTATTLLGFQYSCITSVCYWLLAR